MATQTRRSSEPDALSILTSDHERVEKLFKAFGKARNKEDDREKAARIEEVCLELAIHAAIEEQLVYPMVAKVIGDGDLMGEAVVEHAEAKHLIGLLVGMDPAEALYVPTVQVLHEYVRHHVQEEQDKMFPKVRKARLDLEALGEAILRRKGELMTEVESKGIGGLLAPAKRAAGMQAH